MSPPPTNPRRYTDIKFMSVYLFLLKIIVEMYSNIILKLQAKIGEDNMNIGGLNVVSLIIGNIVMIDKMEFEDFSTYETKDLLIKRDRCRCVHVASKQTFIVLVMSLCATSLMAIYGLGYTIMNQLSSFNNIIQIAFSIWMLIILSIITSMIFITRNKIRSNLSILGYINNELFVREMNELPIQIRPEKLYRNEKKEIQKFYY